MKSRANVLICTLLLLLFACGKKTQPENFVAEDERPATSQEQDIISFEEDLAQEIITVEKADPFLKCEGTTIQREIIVYGTMIEQFGGEINSPEDYEYDLVDFQRFLNLSKSNRFTAADLSKIGSPDIAKECGITTLLPPKSCWLRVAALTLLLDKVSVDKSISARVTSLWRPPCYNKALGGKPSSDHLESRSVDTSFEIAFNRRAAQAYICKNFWEEDLFNLRGLDNPNSKKLNISIGLGGTWMHVGLGSRRGRRYWTYDSYVEKNEASNGCW